MNKQFRNPETFSEAGDGFSRASLPGKIGKMRGERRESKFVRNCGTIGVRCLANTPRKDPRPWNAYVVVGCVVMSCATRAALRVVYLRGG